MSTINSFQVLKIKLINAIKVSAVFHAKLVNVIELLQIINNAKIDKT